MYVCMFMYARLAHLGAVMCSCTGCVLGPYVARGPLQGPILGPTPKGALMGSLQGPILGPHTHRSPHGLDIGPNACMQHSSGGPHWVR